MATLSTEHIERTPGVCGGRARIAGHRIRVLDIAVLHEKMGMSPEEIIQQYPGISMADVYAALAYLFDHREEIEEELRNDEKIAQEFLAQHRSKLQAKLNG